MKVLLSCLFFQNYTGSEMYVFELAKNLVKEGCDVTVVAFNTMGPLVHKSKEFNIKLCNIKHSPGYKITNNQFEKISEVDFDLIHCQHTPVVELMNQLYPNIPKICTIHSEVISLENPVIHPSIKKYIAIRPEIKEHIIKNFKINENNIDVIYNPIDSDKFNSKETKKENYTLFVGTIDFLRKKTIYDLVEETKSKNKELWLVGKNHDKYLERILKNKHIKYFSDTYDVEKFVKNCSETAGILLGRTTIEGWMCGKSGWIYDIDSQGNILSKKLHEPPSDIEKFNSINVTKEIKKLYEEIIKK